MDICMVGTHLLGYGFAWSDMLLHFSGILVFGNENFLTCLLHTVNSYFRDVFTNQ